MNEIKKCSISGISFTLEQNAYDTLSAYIQSLHNAYKDDPDGEEIIADIEARIAELILSTQPADAIIAKPLIDNIIKQLGSAEEIDEEHNEYQAETTDQNGNPRIPRRLYRDLESAKLGGVCAGIANYFDTDPTWIRLAAFIPLFLTPLSGSIWWLNWLTSLSSTLFGVIILGYIIMWFTVPAASSARQKLEMKGERITTNNIRETTQATSAADERERTLLAHIVMAVGRILLIILKIIALFILIGLVCGSAVLSLVGITTVPALMITDLATGLALGAFFMVALMPIIALTYLTIMLLISRRPNGKVMLVMFLLWLISLVGMIVAAIKSPVGLDNQIENSFNSVFSNDEEILYKEFSQSEIDDFRRKIDNMHTSIQQYGDVTITLQGDEQDVEQMEATLKFDEEGLTINSDDDEILKITPNGITIDGEKFVDYTTETVEKEDGKTKAFIFSIGDVKLRFEQALGKAAAKAHQEAVEEWQEAVEEAQQEIEEAQEQIREQAEKIKNEIRRK